MNGVRVETLRDIEQIPRESWDLLAGESAFVDWGFLVALQRSGCIGEATGWSPLYVVVWEGEVLVGAAPMFLKTHSQGEFVFDWGWAEAAERAGIRYYPKGVVGAPFSPVTGVRLLVRDEGFRGVLVDACLAVAQELGLSSVHFNFVLPAEVEVFEVRGLLIRQGIQYHWSNRGYETLDDFLGDLKSKRRANVRRERRQLEQHGVSTRVVRGAELDVADMERLFRYYRNTVQRYPWGQQYLNQAFFEQVRLLIPEQLHVVLAEHRGEVFGGAFNLLKGRRLYGRYWGCEREVEFAHFEVCMYRPIEWCIKHGVQVFEPGAGGEHKHDRGFSATRTWSAHWIAEPRLREAVGRFLRYETDVIAENVELLDAQGAFRKA